MREVEGIRFYDSLAEIVAPPHTALLVVDMQNDFCSPEGHFAHNGKDVARLAPVAPRITHLIAAARERGVPVIYTRQTTLPGLASDTPAWLYFKTRDGKAPDYTVAGTWGAEVISELSPEPSDRVVEKHRPSAFHETGLDALLGDMGIESVVVAGCLTQGCVMATVMDASFHDYYAVVAEDCVGSTSQEQHENALRFLRSRYDVVPSAAIVAVWSGRASG